MDQIIEVENQGRMLEEIYKNIIESLENILKMKEELKTQDEKLVEIDNKLDGIKEKLIETEKVYDGMEKRLFCRKIILWIAVVVLSILNISLVFFIIAKIFRWPPFSK